MLQWVLTIVGIPAVSIVLIFNMRRLLLTGAMFLESRRPTPRTGVRRLSPTVLILASCRDEEGEIPGLIGSLNWLDYPKELLRVVLIDDGSIDDTGVAMAKVAERPGWHAVRLTGVGKAAALNEGLARFPFGEIVVVADADHRFEPQALSRMVAYFDDPRVAAVTGFSRVTNHLSSSVAYYAALESNVNQLVTMRAKDRLSLAPALLGSNCGYRREVLSICGGFRSGSLSEDSDLTVAFHLEGFITRFAEEVVSSQRVPVTVAGFLRQHVRWGRGLNDVARWRIGDILRTEGLSLPLRGELLLFSLGYIDRLAVVVTGVLAVTALLSGAGAGIYLVALLVALTVPLLQIVALFFKERMGWPMWLRLPLVPILFALDVVSATWAAVETVRRAPRRWAATERPGESLP